MWFAKVDIYDKHLPMSKPPKAKRSARRLYSSDASLLATMLQSILPPVVLRNRGLFDWSQTQTSLPLMDRIGDSQQKATPYTNQEVLEQNLQDLGENVAIQNKYQ